MSTETVPLDETISRFLGGLEEPLEELSALRSKTDIDFIVDGRVVPALRSENDKAISEGIKAFNQSVREANIKEMAQADGFDIVDGIALDYAARRYNSIREWFPQSSERMPAIPASVEELRNPLFTTVERVRGVVAFWQNAAPYFSYTLTTHERTKTQRSVHMLPSHGKDNLKIEENSGLRSPREDVIYAEFQEGQGVRVDEVEDKIRSIQVIREPLTYVRAVLGYKSHSHGKPEDFQEAIYEPFDFIGGESESVAERTDGERFAARIALNLLIARDPSLPMVELPKPSDEYCEEVISLLVNSTCRAFLTPAMFADVRHNRSTWTLGDEVEGVNIRHANNLIRTSTVTEMRSFLRAIDRNVDDLYRGISRKLSEKFNSEILGDRIDAMQTQKDIQAFVGTLY